MLAALTVLVLEVVATAGAVEGDDEVKVVASDEVKDVDVRKLDDVLLLLHLVVVVVEVVGWRVVVIKLEDKEDVLLGVDV